MNYTNGHLDSSNLKCKICKKDNLEFVFITKGNDDFNNKIFYLFRCKDCGVINIFPSLDAVQIESLYFNEYYGNFLPGFKYILNFFNNLFLDYKVRKVIEYTKRSGIILDYGCGNAEFLIKMKQYGWEIYGIEPSINCNLEFVKKSLKDLKLDKKFDLITLWHVFEHLDRPIECLSNLLKLIDSKGILFLSLPNFDSWESLIGKGKWFHLDIPRHIVHYTPESIIKLLEKNGLSIIKIDYFSIFYNTFGVLQTIFNICGFEQNFLYNTLKRGVNYRKKISLLYLIYNVVFHLILFIPILFISFIFSIISSVFKKSGTIEIICRKRI